MSDNDINVPLLADSPAKDNLITTTAAALLIRAAKEDRLVAVVCTHQETLEPTVIMCIMDIDGEGNAATYTPASMLFTPGNTPWVEYIPPKAAIHPVKETEDGKDGLREAS